MSLRARLALAFALVAVVVAGTVGALSYHAAAERTTEEIDRSLRSASAAIAAGATQVLAPTPMTSPFPGPLSPGGPEAERQPLAAQVVAPDGSVRFLGGRAVAIPVDDDVRALAAAASGRTGLAEFDAGRDTYRVLSTSLGDGRGVLQVARDIDQTRDVLSGTAAEILWTGALVALAAAVAGWLVARRITRRLVRLAAAAVRVSESGRPDADVDVGGRDEVGRLSASFTTMLERLATARDAQERLVQDVAHELRTPLTSLRTNAAVLRRAAELTPDARDRLLDDVEGETRELSRLVDELVDLALSRHADEPERTVALADVLERAADRVRRRTGREVVVLLDSTAPGAVTVRGRPRALERAVGNLLENAAKFAPGPGPIEVRARDGRIVVADRGPGIDPDDAPHVFDRFFRADAARGLPGSGLGLAIVADVAAAHDGTTFAGPREGGGAEVGFTVGPDRFLPGSEPDDDGVSPPVSRVDGA